MTDKLKPFENQKYLNIETFRRNGQGVKTPVWFAQDGETLYVRTIANSGKVKRIKHNGRVHIVPCEMNGKPTGEWVNAQAVETTDAAIADVVGQLLEKKYGKVQVSAFAATTALSGKKYTVLKINLEA